MQDTFSLVRKGSKNKASKIIKFRMREERKEKREDGRGHQRAERCQEGQEAHTVTRRPWDAETVTAPRGLSHSAGGKCTCPPPATQITHNKSQDDLTVQYLCS